MEGNSKFNPIEETMLDLLSSYNTLESCMIIFNNAVDYDTSLDNKYNNMVKVINRLVLDIEPSIAQLSEQLKELLADKEEG